MEKKKNDVTIIIPVYNAEKYLRDCLDSLINQDYNQEKYEIILVNDCSSDNSVKIIKEYQKKYSNVVLFDLKKKAGVSNARNVGIKNATGEYLMFCDADDVYEKDSISSYMRVVKEENSDYVVSNHYVSINNKLIPIDDTSSFTSNKPTKNEIIAYLPISSWAKLIKKSLFLDNAIEYPLGIKRYEELNVIPKLAYLAKKPVIIKDYLYHYVQIKTSASNRNKTIDLESLRCMKQGVIDFEKSFDKNKYKDEIEFRVIDQYIYGFMLVELKMG